jgi:hypothetical protein
VVILDFYSGPLAVPYFLGVYPWTTHCQQAHFLGSFLLGFSVHLEMLESPMPNLQLGIWTQSGLGALGCGNE